MYLDVNSSKTYDNWLADNTDFFSNLENNYDVTVDPGTQDLIELFFGNRFVCDDNNFERYYKRTLLNTWDRYIDLLRIEKTEIDPLVADYFENQLVHTGENTGSKSGTTSNTTAYGKTDTLTHNVTVTEDNTITDDVTDTRTLNLAKGNTRTNDLADSHTRTDNLAYDNTRTDNLANSNTRTDDLENSDTRTDNLTTTTDNKTARADAVNPQSIEYSGTTAGSLPGLDWQYMSNQAQEEGEGSEHNTGTVTNRGTNTGTVTNQGTQTGTVTDQGTNTGTVTNAGTNTGTITDAGTETGTDTLVKDADKVEDKEKHTTGTDTHALTGEDEITGSTSENTSGTDTHTDRERHTGRTGILPQEALRKAKAYIQKSRAFDWLKDELEPCFISIYDI